MEELIAIILSVLLLLALVPLYLWKRRQDSRSPHEHDEPPQVRFSPILAESRVLYLHIYIYMYISVPKNNNL